MMISDEQVRRAVEYLQTTGYDTALGSSQSSTGIRPELLDRVRRALSESPDLRDDRIAHARALLEGAGPSGAEVAEKIIGRAISDSLR